MQEILKTTQLECSKSTFLLDLIKHNNGSLFIELAQYIRSDVSMHQSIKINPVILNDLIKTLLKYQAIIDKDGSVSSNILSGSVQAEIERRYLIGVPLVELSLQFEQPPELIENILRNRGIEIVTNTDPPKRIHWRRKRRKA